MASFDAILAHIESARICGYLWESGKDERLKACNRASFSLEVEPAVYDPFFNSPVGYRAQYAKSPEFGDDANQRILARLERRLVRYAVEQYQANPSIVRVSL